MRNRVHALRLETFDGRRWYLCYDSQEPGYVSYIYVGTDEN